MASREIRPKTRLGQHDPRKVKAAFILIGLLVGGGGLYAAYHYASKTEVEVPVARVMRGDFVISVRVRGDIKSTRSTVVYAPQVPGLRIMKLARNGSLVKKGDVVVEFDAETQRMNVLNRTNSVQQADGSIEQLKASQRMEDEQNASQKMQYEFSLERARLEASRAAVLSAIEGEKARVDVGVAEGSLQMVRSRIYANSVGNAADLGRVNQQRANYVTNLKLAESYLNQMKILAPADGVVNILTNFRSQGTFGRAGAPPFKEGDNVWTGAQIMEIPDLSQMYIELKLDEVDRGKIALGQEVKIHVDSIPEKEFLATLDFISPAASLVFSGVGANAQQSTEKNFPAQATLKKLDDRLRPGTSASAEIIVERQPNTLTIPLQANFDQNGKPIVYVQNGGKFEARRIQIGKRNESEVVVTSGLEEGEIIATQDPIKLARQTKKKM